MIKRHLGVSALCLFLGFTSAQAAVVSYDSQASFLSALGTSSITHNFDSSADDTIIANGDTVNGATFTYTLLAPGTPSIKIDNSFDTTSPDNYLGTDDGSDAFVSGDSFTITFDQTMHAIGLYVISIDEIFADDFTITTSAGQSVTNTTVADVILADGASAYYIGLIEDDFTMGFNSITLSSFDAGYIFNVDDITVAPVPLPAAFWLFGSGLLCLTGLSRRKLRKL